MSQSYMPKINHKISSNMPYLLTFVLILAALVRIVFYFEINTGPFISQHDWDQSDMNYFDQWAKNIVEGDWLTEHNFHPLHRWHRMIVIADDYFQANPDLAQKYVFAAGGGTTSAEPARLLWNHWYGEKTFHQEPLYERESRGQYLLLCLYFPFKPAE
ncbi:MAG: hypothetical protein M0Z67_13515 [Nitrospiraceae bacterium]|nr:hypothetical protein [Nitrospiraceae bacterium]